jgi:hypothetical protein
MSLSNVTNQDDQGVNEFERLIKMLASYLQQANAGALPVLPHVDPDTMLQRWNLPITASGKGMGDAFTLLSRTLAESNHLHHPRYMGHQVSAPLPLAALCDFVSALLNNSTAVYEMAQVATVMEAHLVRWIAGLAGFDAARAGGLFTSGGSLGTLTALLAARQVMGKRKGIGDLWRDGYAPGGPRPAVLVSAQAHYCVLRAVQIMGLGEQGIVPVRTDSALRVDPSALAAGYETARLAGREPIAVVANACSTPTGSYDPKTSGSTWMVLTASAPQSCHSMRRCLQASPVRTRWCGTCTRCCVCQRCAPPWYFATKRTRMPPSRRMLPISSRVPPSRNGTTSVSAPSSAQREWWR